MEKIANPFKDHHVPDTWLEEEDRKILRESLSYFDDIDGGHSFFQITHFILSDKDFPLKRQNAAFHGCAAGARIAINQLFKPGFSLLQR